MYSAEKPTTWDEEAVLFLNFELCCRRKNRDFRRAAAHSFICIGWLNVFKQPVSMDELSEVRRELQRDFKEFLDQDFGAETGAGKYAQQMQDIIKHYSTVKRVRLAVDLQGEHPPAHALITCTSDPRPTPALMPSPLSACYRPV